MSAAEYPFHPSLWPKSIVRPEEHTGGDRLRLSWDGRIDDSEKKKVIAAWVKALPALTEVTHLIVWSHVTQQLFDAICAMAALESLQLKWSNIRSLERISHLTKLRILSIGSSTRVESVEPLSHLSNLEMLELENFKLVQDFSPLLKLESLRDLSVTGSMWSRQDIGELDTFSRMTWLDSLCVDTSNVSSIQGLAALSSLKSLGVGGRLPYQEYAWLAAKLPQTECQWFRPFLDLSGTGYSPCKKCRGDTMVMVTGKGKPVLCRVCDETKLAKHVSMFEAARATPAGET